MQTLLSAIAVAAGALGLLIAVLMRGRQAFDLLRRGGLLPLFALVAVGPLLAALLAAPTQPPFAVGFDLGWGILLGGALALLVAADAAAGGDRPGLRAAAPLAAAGFGPALLLLRYHGDPVAAVTGCALGAVAAALGGGIVFRVRRDLPPLHRALEAYAVLTTVAVAAIRLAIDHFPRSAATAVAGGYWALPALSLTVAALVLLLLASSRKPVGPWYAGLQAAVVLPLVAVVLQFRVLEQRVWPVELIGLAALGLGAGVLALEERQGAARPTGSAFGLLLAALAAAGLAFRLLHGFGEAMALLPAAVLLGTVYVNGPRDEEPLAPALGLGAVALLAVFTLMRLLFEQFGYANALDFQRFYDAISLLLGAGIAFLPATLLPAPASPYGRGSIRAMVLLAAAAVAVPFAVGLLWGIKTFSALLLGGTVGMMAWTLLAAWSTGDDRRRALAALPAAAMLALALTTVQVVPRLLVHALTRTQKIWLVAILAGVAIAWTVIDMVLRARQQDEVSHVEA